MYYYYYMCFNGLFSGQPVQTTTTKVNCSEF